MNLRKEARGRDCQIRLPGVCNGNPETTVLAHYRASFVTGFGYKPESADICGAWACSDCHDVVDRRRSSYMDHADIDRLFLHGVLRTIAALVAEGKIKWGK